MKRVKVTTESNAVSVRATRGVARRWVTIHLSVNDPRAKGVVLGRSRQYTELNGNTNKIHVTSQSKAGRESDSPKSIIRRDESVQPHSKLPLQGLREIKK